VRVRFQWNSAIRNIVIVCEQRQHIKSLRARLDGDPVVVALGARLKFELVETYYRRLWP